jgi:CHAP domain
VGSVRRRAAVTAVVGTGIVLAGIGGLAARAGASTPVIASRLALADSQAQRLLRMYAAYRHIPVADIAVVLPGSAQAAQVAGRGSAAWAAIRFRPSAGAPRAVQIGFQDGGGTGVFTRPAGGAWRIVGLGGEPLGCAAGLPAPVRRLWRLDGCLAGSAGSPPAAARPAGSGEEELANIAEDQVGVADNPAETSFAGLDCNPYTALEAPGTTTSGCGTDPRFRLKDASELWCADFAKWVWLEAGVKRGVSVLTPAAASFFTWGERRHEGLRTDAANPRVGDAVVFYPAGSPPNGHYADHVGIVTAVNSDGSIDLVNGDFLSTQNISVQTDDDITNLGQWAGEMWGTGEQWVFVKPRFPHTTPPPPTGGTSG